MFPTKSFFFLYIVYLTNSVLRLRLVPVDKNLKYVIQNERILLIQIEV